MKAALTKTNKERNWALRKADELLKAAAPTAKVELKWDQRCVNVDAVPAFGQDKVELRGSLTRQAFLRMQGLESNTDSPLRKPRRKRTYSQKMMSVFEKVEFFDH